MLGSLAAATHGVITTARARSAGITKDDLRTRVKDGFLRKAGYGCYLLDSRCDELTSAALAQAHQPAAVLAGRSAAFHYRLDGFDYDVAAPDHVIAVRPRLPSPALAVGTVDHRDITWRGGVRILRPVAAVGSLGHWTGPDEVEWALECALRRKLATEDEFSDWLRRAAGPPAGCRSPDDPGRAALRAVMARRGSLVPPTESFLETLAIQRVFRPQGFAIERQVVVRNDAGDFIGRVDFQLDGALLVEVNGLGFHAGPVAVQRDAWRALSLRLAGREVEHITWYDVTERAEVTGRRLRARCQQVTAAAERSPAAGRSEHVFV